MLKNLGCLVLGLTLTACWLSDRPALAQNAVLNEFYGSGVHNYYERDYFAAMSDLSTAIDGGSKDPRVYYYRGLARMKSGDSGGAHQDLRQGAALESADINQFYPVAKSLERVQGSERQTLERYRSLARAQARQRQIRRDAVRYEQRRRAEAQVLRAVPVGPPPAALADPGAAPADAAAAGAAVPPAPAPGNIDPAAPAAEPAGASPFDTPPAAEPPAAGSPFDTPADPPAAGSPFEVPAEAPAAGSPFEAPADAPAADPFGAAAPDGAEMPADDAPVADPFGDDQN